MRLLAVATARACASSRLRLPTYFSYQYGLETAAASAASASPFLVAAFTCAGAGAASDALVARGMSLTNVRKLAGAISTAGPAVALLTLAFGASSIDYATAQAIFVGALALHAGT